MCFFTEGQLLNIWIPIQKILTQSTEYENLEN